MSAYYNENDPFAAAWLRNLIDAKLIAAGDVDERSIVDVKSDDLKSYDQIHLFAGIGGWSYALRLAGWPDSRPVWTGSCPCQPLSSAGQRKGHADERHLWPAFYNLVSECHPATVFGEQVASKDGREWLAGVRADLEGLGYAVGAADLCAASVGAPHRRQRLWWVADANGTRENAGASSWQQSIRNCYSARSKATRIAERDGLEGSSRCEEARQALAAPWAASAAVVCNGGERKRIPLEPGLFPLVDGVSNRMDRVRAAGNAIVPQVAAAFVKAAMEAGAS